MTDKGSRRDFFRSEGATDSGVKSGMLSSSLGDSAEPLLLQVSRSAMASEFELFFNAGQYENDAAGALQALDLVQSLEDQLSYFRPTSQIGRVNALAAEMPVEVEPWLFQLLQLAMDLNAQTKGAIDIASATLWEVWGFSRRAGRVPAEEELAEAKKRSGSNLVELDPERKTVRFKKPGVRLNLGSIGKGYALDRAAELLQSAKVDDFLFHGGQSSVLARGSRGTGGAASRAGAKPGWSIGIKHPLFADRRIGEIRLQDRALGTSGSATQFFRHRGRRYSHILDPRTGRPADGVLSATVVAPTAVLADGLSTAFFVLGPQETLAFCRNRPEIAALLVCSKGNRDGHEVFTAGFRDDQVSLF